jgi:probable HAF family extracellular repeat protein
MLFGRHGPRPVMKRSERPRPMRKPAVLGAIVSVGLMGVVAGPALATTYSVTDLGSLGNGYTVAKAINNNGQVTGRSSLSSTFQVSCPPKQYGGQKKCFRHPYHAFLWEAGTMKDLGTLGGNFSEGDAINNLGEVVGSSETKTGSEAFLFRNGKMTGIGSFGVAGINDFGEIIGNGSNGGFLISGGTTTTLVGFGPSAINNNHQIAGGIAPRVEENHAAIWNNGTITDLGTLGGPLSVAYAINNAGQVVGFSQTSTYADHGFVWQNGKMTDLGENVFPYAINNKGEIAGSGGCGAAIILVGGICQNLQNLIPANSGYTLFEAKGINDKGQIMASAQTGGGEAVVLTPNS